MHSVCESPVNLLFGQDGGLTVARLCRLLLAQGKLSWVEMRWVHLSSVHKSIKCCQWMRSVFACAELCASMSMCSRLDMLRHQHGDMSGTCPGGLEMSGGRAEANHVTLLRHLGFFSGWRVDRSSLYSSELMSGHWLLATALMSRLQRFSTERLVAKKMWLKYDQA